MINSLNSSYIFLSLGSIPWQAALISRGSNRPWCGGTLISDGYVLTAAHCVHRKTIRDIQVVLGKCKISTFDRQEHMNVNIFQVNMIGQRQKKATILE